MKKLGKYKKFIVAAAGLVALTIGVPVAGMETAAAESVNALLALLTAAGVYVVPNSD